MWTLVSSPWSRAPPRACALQARELGFSDDGAVSAILAVLGLRPGLDVER